MYQKYRDDFLYDAILKQLRSVLFDFSPSEWKVRRERLSYPWREDFAN